MRKENRCSGEVDSTFDSIRTEYGMGYRWLAKALMNATDWLEKQGN